MKTPEIRSTWVRFSEESNALDFLEKAYRFIKETEHDKTAWKWVVICLHGALYGFAICACKGTNFENVTFRNKKGELKLITFNKTLEMCQDHNIMKMLSHSQNLILTPSQKNSVRRLKKELRNNFEHYIPSGWSIEIHGMPMIAIDVLDIIKFLATQTYTHINLAQAQIKKIKSYVYQSKRLLVKSKLYKELKLIQAKSDKA